MIKLRVQILQPFHRDPTYNLYFLALEIAHELRSSPTIDSQFRLSTQLNQIQTHQENESAECDKKILIKGHIHLTTKIKDKRS